VPRKQRTNSRWPDVLLSWFLSNAESMALASAIFYGINTILVAMGLRNGPTQNVLSATTINMIGNLVVLGIPYAYFHPNFVLEAFLIFAAAGILAQCISRALNYSALQKLGLCVSQPIVGASPAFATLFAIVLMGEAVSVPVYIGTAVIILGVAILSQCRRRPRFDVKGSWILIGIPLLAASTYGLGITLRKLALGFDNSALSGATLAIAASLPIYVIGLVAVGKGKQIGLSAMRNQGKSVWFYFGGGLATAVGFLLYFSALSVGKVSIVSPIQGSYPLFAVLLSQIFLRESEKISVKLVIAALTIIVGVAVVSM
jgi:uncharacterized membrane protein